MQVADEWELKRDDIKVMKDKPLGTGAFGEVFRGILQPSAKVSHLKNSQSNQMMNYVVAVKILKGLTSYIKIYSIVVLNYTMISCFSS